MTCNNQLASPGLTPATSKVQRRQLALCWLRIPWCLFPSLWSHTAIINRRGHLCTRAHPTRLRLGFPRSLLRTWQALRPGERTAGARVALHAALMNFRCIDSKFLINGPTHGEQWWNASFPRSPRAPYCQGWGALWRGGFCSQ